jgi:hypothetical protein
MEEKFILEKREQEMDNDLKTLRERIKTKRNNINDLESVFQQDIRKYKKIAWYVYILIVIHFLVMLYGWSQNKGVVFAGNLWMHYWLLKKIYREIYMKFAIPCSLLILFISVTMY